LRSSRSATIGGSSVFVAATHLVHLGGGEQVAVLDTSKENPHTFCRAAHHCDG
jgi:hypothetical protein